MSRHPMLRLFLRRERTRLRAADDLQRSELLNSVLGDPDLLDSVSSAVDDEYTRDAQVSGAFGGDLLSFFKWLVEHREELLKLILLIVGLFATETPE